MTLGQKLRRQRIEKNYTQKELADRLNVTFQTVSKWESDTNEPDISTLKELSKLLECSIEYFFKDDDEDDEYQTQPAKTEPQEVQQPVVQTVVVNKVTPHRCQKCGKEIAEEDLVTYDAPHRTRHGRHYTTTYTKVYYHKDCLDQKIEEDKKIQEERKAEYTHHAIKWTLFWTIFTGILALGISLIVIFLNPQWKESLKVAGTILVSVGIGLAVSTAAYCICSGSYIADVFLWCATRSIKFPMLIFSWDLDGFVWLIAMKILFAILGFLFGLFTFVFAVAFASALGIISFPFVLVSNISNGYENSLFYND